MKQRGRKSVASLAVMPGVAVTGKVRLQPPASLSADHATVWLQVVNDHPAGAFTGTHTPLLEMYCRHVVQARFLAVEVGRYEPSWLTDDDGLKRYDRLLAMAERESRAASSLATRLRITRQAIDAKTAGRPQGNTGGPNLWDR